MFKIKIKLDPVKHNRRAVLQAIRDCTIHCENAITILTIQIGSETIIIKVPP